MLVACGAQRVPVGVADTIFVGDQIVTMDPARLEVQAVAVKGERIVAAGSREDVMAWRGEATRFIELGERALLPGFIDAHGHLLQAGRDLETLSLHSPPVGDVTDIAGLLDKARRYIAQEKIEPGEPVLGFGYDDSLLAEGRHPTRFDLDEVSTQHPIVLRHVSGHLRVANSAALAASGITAGTRDPEGGRIRRVAGSNEPNGVIEGLAMRLLAGSKQKLSRRALERRMRKAIDVYLAHGTTTIQSGGRNKRKRIEAYQRAAGKEPFRADVAAFAQVDTLLAREARYSPLYADGFRVAGVKFSLDGSPQGRTAWLSEPYSEGPEGAPAGYRAYGRMDPAVYRAQAAELIERGVPILAHANGDAAIDLMLDGIEAAVADSDALPDHRSVIIHAQLMRADQLDRAARLGVVPSFFAAHAFFWGDWHRRSFGEERASNISPVRWAIDRGVRFTVHNDASVVPPDIMRLISITVNRTTRSGFVLGAHQRATIMEALHAVTLGAAFQYFEEDTKGSITVGKQADLVVLGRNPLTTDPAQLAEIPIIETFARGVSVYRRDAAVR